MKKLLSFFLIIAMLLPSLGIAFPIGAEGDFDSSKVFIDVPAKAWYREYVDFVASRGIMGGSGQENTFKPADLSTRAMVTVILHRLEGEPAASSKAPFTDLKQKWYIPAAHWAYESGVVKGSSGTTFNPNGMVTRQELVTMLYRYAEYRGLDVSQRQDFSDFADAKKVANWAKESMEWALATGLINGRDEGGKVLLAPKGNTPRREMAAMLSRFITKLEEGEKAEVDPLYANADSLKATAACETHRSSLHMELGQPSGLTQAQLSVAIVSALGLDLSIYSAELAGGAFEKFFTAYSAVKNGDFATIPLTFELTNLRTLGETVKFEKFPVAVRRNDWSAYPHAIECDAPVIADEELNFELAEFDSLYTCSVHDLVHVEATSFTEADLKDTILGLMSRSPAVYTVELEGNGYNTLKSAYDKLAVGGETDAVEVSFRLNNELIKKDCGKDSASDTVTVKFAVVKTDEFPCRAIECPYDRAAKAVDAFEKKYICNEHGKAHIALNYSGAAKLSDVEALVKDVLDLGALYNVTLDSTAFKNGKIKVNLDHFMGYDFDGLTFEAVYTYSVSSDKAAKFILCENERDAYKLILHDGYSGNTGYGAWNYGQTESGWLLDTRADDAVHHGIINDVSIFEASQVIREINNTAKGVITHRCGVTVTSGFDGVLLDFRNATGDSVMRLETKDGVWKLLQKDGSYKTVYDPNGETKFVFTVKIDLYAETVSIIINDVDCGTYELSTTGVNVNIQNFRFASTEQDKVTFSMDLCDTSVNYSMWEYFADFHCYSTLPTGWKYENALISPNTGVLSDAKLFDHYVKIDTDGYIEKSFEPTDGKVIAQFNILPAVSGSNTEFTVLGEESELFRVTTDDTSFYVNGKKAYDYAKNVWYYFYLICDTESGKVQLKINGIDRGEFALAKNNVPLDTVKVTNSGSSVTYDAFIVYNEVYHSDYVPEPVKPEGEEEFTVGINVCSMWQNGFHGGWACLTPYDDTKPVLGYYDEGNPETADWEIKYLVEHGVDFQSVVLFGIQDTGPVTTGLGMHLEDGYKYAKYSDMLDYSLIWCSASATSPEDMDAWKTYFVPYFIEYHFKDPRYLKIDNKIVFQTFRFIDSHTCPYWTPEKRKEAFDYLDEQVKLLGYDGVLYITEELHNVYHSEEGIEGLYSYNQGQYGISFETLKARILELDALAKKEDLTYVPSVAIGFNCVGWMNPRTPLMPVEDFKLSNEWIRDEYFPANADVPEWAKNLVIVCTWNEYGEGHYVMPSDGLAGFGYLDVLREAYTSADVDESVNIRPTEEQLERINRLYPQHIKLIRAEERGTYTNGIYEKRPYDPQMTEWVADLDVGSCVIGKDDNITVKNDIIENTSDKRGLVTIALNTKADLSKCAGVDLLIEMPAGTSGFMTIGTGTHSKIETITSEMITGTGEQRYYGISIYEDRVGEIVQIRIPAGAKIYSGKISAVTMNIFPQELVIQGNEIPYKVLPEMSPAGDYLWGFDTIFTDLHLFGMFAQWDDENGKLTINSRAGTLEFTVGASTYMVNGVPYQLGFKLYETDGVPMIPLNRVAAHLGQRLEYTNTMYAVIP